MKNKRLNQRDASIPTSSLADMAFLLIVFFLLTSFIAMTKGIFYKPEESRGKGPEKQGIYLHLNDMGRLIIDGKESELNEIRPYLKAVLRINPNKPVIIYCSLNQNYQSMMEIIDEVKKAEVDLYGEFNKGKKLEERKHISIYIPTSDEEKIFKANISSLD